MRRDSRLESTLDVGGLFVAIGHEPNTSFLANLFPDHAGRLLPTDCDMQTSIPGIYAIGDVAGPPALASASYDQGRFAGAQIARGNSDWELITDFPTGIYTMPEYLEVRYSLVWEYSPMQFLQGRIGVRAYDGPPQRPVANREVVFAELHGFF